MSEKSRMASRANGARSRGPVTPEGKRRSSRNAERHGLLAKCAVLDIESREGFDSLMKGFLDRLNPADDVELGIIEEMLVAFWRQRRAWAIETRMIDSAMGQAAGSDPMSRLAEAFASAAGDRLDLVHRYEARLHRIFHRSLRNLLMMRSVAMAPHEHESPNETSTTASQSQQDLPAEVDRADGAPREEPDETDPEACPREPDNTHKTCETKICETNLEVQLIQQHLVCNTANSPTNVGHVHRPHLTPPGMW